MALHRAHLELGLEQAVVNLRISGLSERAVYEGLREMLVSPPSYRDLRAVYERHGVNRRAQATTARRAGKFLTEIAQRPQTHSRYKERLRATRAVSGSPAAYALGKTQLDRQYILGQLARGHVEADKLEPEDMETMERIYDDLET